MNNFERLKEIGMVTIKCVYNEDFEEIGLNIVIKLRKKDYENFYKKGFDWLFQEYKEPIKLKQWEYDLIKIHTDPLRACFCNFGTLVKLHNKGYFKGIKDTSMSIQYILNNCIIVSDDYEGFEEECK